MARTRAKLGAGARLADYLTVGYLALNCPLERVRAVLSTCNAHSRRKRSLPHEALVYYVMCMCLYRKAAYEEVLHLVVEGLREIYGEDFADINVNKAAISLARSRVGAAPLEMLYRQSVGPIGPPGMPGVWYHDWRVMGLDGSTLELSDEAANAAHFGYPSGLHGQGALPQLRLCALAECGTHVLIGAQCAPYGVSEQALAHQVLGYADGRMLIIADRGFMGYPLWLRAVQSQAKLLFRVRDDLLLPVAKTLADGSYLSQIKPDRKSKAAGQVAQPVRVIEYRLEGSAERYRLITNLLDDTQHPAQALAALYHRRWKVETALFEIKKQLNDNLALRSKTPELVQQEFFALLIAHAAIRSLMTQAAAQSKQASQDLSFVHTVSVIKRRLAAQAALSP